MCTDCGCETVKLEVKANLLAKNDHLAQHNRQHFAAHGLKSLNVLSSPGSGKTAWIKRMLQDWQRFPGLPPLRAGVIVGDLATDNDARRLREVGIPTVQITTGNACHLDANMIAKAAEKLDLDYLNLLIIENVGNLVCPAGYDLGEDLRVVLMSVTEGEDKPLKYPIMFKTANVIILNKIDIAEAVEFEQATALVNLQGVAPQAKIFQLSAKTGQGMEQCCQYLAQVLQPISRGDRQPTQALPQVTG